MAFLYYLLRPERQNRIRSKFANLRTNAKASFSTALLRNIYLWGFLNHLKICFAHIVPLMQNQLCKKKKQKQPDLTVVGNPVMQPHQSWGLLCQLNHPLTREKWTVDKQHQFRRVGRMNPKHHDLAIQSCLVRWDGSTGCQRQVDMLMLNDKLLLRMLKYCDWQEMWMLIRLVSICKKKKPSGEASSCSYSDRCWSDVLTGVLWLAESGWGLVCKCTAGLCVCSSDALQSFYLHYWFKSSKLVTVYTN